MLAQKYPSKAFLEPNLAIFIPNLGVFIISRYLPVQQIRGY